MFGLAEWLRKSRFTPTNKSVPTQSTPLSTNIQRKCRFESLEPRYVLSVNPVVLGVTYLETDPGSDTPPDEFVVSFQGGSEQTQLTQFAMSGDQDLDGTPTQSDIIFDIGPGLPGVGHFHGFQFDAAKTTGLVESDILGVSISNNGLEMAVDVQNFEAGDRLVFTIDVDEIEGSINDPIASATEFENTRVTATWSDPGYEYEKNDFVIDVVLSNGVTQSQVSDRFYDEYDVIFAEGSAVSGNTIDVPSDHLGNQSSRTAGGIVSYQAIPKPISISGNVYNDANLDCVKGPSEDNLQGVDIELYLLDEGTGQYNLAATTTTDVDGNYEFDESLGLVSGTYQLRQLNTDGFFNAGATTGSFEGQETGQVINNGKSQPTLIEDIQIDTNGVDAVNFDFKLVQPAEIGGSVFSDIDGDGVRDLGEPGIEGVAIRLERTSGLSPNYDPFGNEPVVTVFTDSNGNYLAQNLAPGTYSLTEVNEYPTGPNPLSGFIDGQESLGRVDGNLVGLVSNDAFQSVAIAGAQVGSQYDFAELLPVSFSGTVFHDTDLDCLHSPGEDGVADITIRLERLDPATNQYTAVATTQTDSDGQYEFGTDLGLTRAPIG